MSKSEELNEFPWRVEEVCLVPGVSEVEARTLFHNQKAFERLITTRSLLRCELRIIKDNSHLLRAAVSLVETTLVVISDRE